MRPKGVADAQTVEIPSPRMRQKADTSVERNRGVGSPRRKGPKQSREVLSGRWREKAKHMCPYRKPTQVDEERILRPAGEGLLRNSAN